MPSTKAPDPTEWVVLMVDDDQENLDVLQETMDFLLAQGCIAHSAEEALDRLQTLTPTMIITDISMHAVDGYEFFTRSRRLPHLAHVPIIALTAHAMPGDKEKILNFGFNGYMSKPFNFNTVAQELQGFLQQTLDQLQTPADGEPDLQTAPPADLLIVPPSSADDQLNSQY